MLAHNYFGVGFLRGLNSTAEVFAHHSGEHERSLLGQMRIDQIMPGGADRLLCMAEKEQTHRIADANRGQYLGWSLAAGAVIAAAVVSLCHGLLIKWWIGQYYRSLNLAIGDRPIGAQQDDGSRERAQHEPMALIEADGPTRGCPGTHQHLPGALVK
jgi:hypothetical protein